MNHSLRIYAILPIIRCPIGAGAPAACDPGRSNTGLPMTISSMAAAPAATLASLAADLAAGRSSSRSLLEACLERIEQAGGEGGRVFLKVDRDAALEQADAMDGRRKRGALP